MTSITQQRYWVQPSQKQRQMSWNYSQSLQEDQFLPVHHSRKGMHLNIPKEFYNITQEQSCIMNIPVLNTGGCCDMEYVLLRQQILNEQKLYQPIPQPYQNTPNYSPSVTINIGAPSPPTQYGCNHKLSYSTVSINPSTLISEEPWHQKRTIIPTGLYCNCENRTTCTHKVTNIKSKEQRMIEPGSSLRTLNDNEYVYVTAPPKISPIRALWKIFSCKRRKRLGEVYLPWAMVKREPEYPMCPKCSTTTVKNTNLNKNPKINPYGNPSRLSTITESEITVSEYSSEEFVLPNEKEQKKKEKSVKRPKRTYTHAGKLVGNGSLNSEMYSQSFFPQGQMHKWVCQPVKEQKKRFLSSISREKYICYKETTV